MRIEQSARYRDRKGGGRAESGRDGQARPDGVSLRRSESRDARDVHVQVQERLRRLDRLQPLLARGNVPRDVLVREQREQLVVGDEIAFRPRFEHARERGRERRDFVPREGGGIPRLRVGHVGEDERQESVGASFGEAVAPQVDRARDRSLSAMSGGKDQRQRPVQVTTRERRGEKIGERTTP